MKFLWSLAVLSSAIGGLFVVFGLLIAKSAPQEAAAASIGIGLALVPCCFAFAVEKLAGSRPH